MNHTPEQFKGTTAAGFTPPYAEMHDQLCATLELTDLGDLYPNTAELITRRILTLPAGDLALLLAVIDTAKARYAVRSAQ